MKLFKILIYQNEMKVSVQLLFDLIDQDFRFFLEQCFIELVGTRIWSHATNKKITPTVIINLLKCKEKLNMWHNLTFLFFWKINYIWLSSLTNYPWFWIMIWTLTPTSNHKGRPWFRRMKKRSIFHVFHSIRNLFLIKNVFIIFF